MTTILSYTTLTRSNDVKILSYYARTGSLERSKSWRILAKKFSYSDEFGEHLGTT